VRQQGDAAPKVRVFVSGIAAPSFVKNPFVDGLAGFFVVFGKSIAAKWKRGAESSIGVQLDRDFKDTYF